MKGYAGQAENTEILNLKLTTILITDCTDYTEKAKDKKFVVRG